MKMHKTNGIHMFQNIKTSQTFSCCFISLPFEWHWYLVHETHSEILKMGGNVLMVRTAKHPANSANPFLKI